MLFFIISNNNRFCSGRTGSNIAAEVTHCAAGKTCIAFMLHEPVDKNESKHMAKCQKVLSTDEQKGVAEDVKPTH